MAHDLTIDGAGRLVIPKPLRKRLNLGPGARLHAYEEDGRLVLAPGRPAPRLLERDGFLVVDVRLEAEIGGDLGRDDRLRGLLEYALQR
jgi:AbrB family looped-hinge helix DNA binding protein